MKAMGTRPLRLAGISASRIRSTSERPTKMVQMKRTPRSSPRVLRVSTNGTMTNQATGLAQSHGAEARASAKPLSIRCSGWMSSIQGAKNVPMLSRAVKARGPRP